MYLRGVADLLAERVTREKGAEGTGQRGGVGSAPTDGYGTGCGASGPKAA